MSHRRHTLCVGLPSLVGLLSLACAGPAPRLFPAEPVARRDLSTAGVELQYDTDNDGTADFAERLSPEGRIVALRYDAANTDGATNGNIVDLDALKADDCRELLIIVDSVPFDLVEAARDAGRFRLFYPPGRIISPFPVMTDLCLSEFFAASPCPGVESKYFDGQGLTDGYGTYMGHTNRPWLRFVDYHLDHRLHGAAYLRPVAWLDHELRRIQELFRESTPRTFAAYAVSTSGIGMRRGREGHVAGLARLDRFCQFMVHETHGRVRITLMSDHGHNLARTRRVDLTRWLEQKGFRPADSLRQPGDVVIPEFGLVSCAAVHTREPEKVAAAAVGLEGVDLTVYRERGAHYDEERPQSDSGTGVPPVIPPAEPPCHTSPGEPRESAPSAGRLAESIVILGADGRATLERRGDAYRYIAEIGDPLKLDPILERLRSDGRVDADGFVADSVWFDATADHVYPDAAHRLWRAFHGLVGQTPDVLVSLKDGYHHGSPFMSAILAPAAVHGNLLTSGSSGFVMTTAGPLPLVLRMEDARAALAAIGVSAENRDVLSPGRSDVREGASRR